MDDNPLTCSVAIFPGSEGDIRFIMYDHVPHVMSIVSWSEFFGWREALKDGSWAPCSIAEVLSRLGLERLAPMMSDPAGALLAAKVMET